MYFTFLLLFICSLQTADLPVYIFLDMYLIFIYMPYFFDLFFMTERNFQRQILHNLPSQWTKSFLYFVNSVLYFVIQSFGGFIKMYSGMSVYFYFWETMTRTIEYTTYPMCLIYTFNQKILTPDTPSSLTAYLCHLSFSWRNFTEGDLRTNEWMRPRQNFSCVSEWDANLLWSPRYTY